MQWQKVPPELIEFMDKAMAVLPCHRKVMFGSPVYFVNDNMFAGLHESNLFVRLSEADRAQLAATVPEARALEPMPGRPMREYIVLPPAVYQDEGAFNYWVDRALQHARSLPPKLVKPRKPRKKAE
jgi:TfoX/Sxy family transcriptional regulator of competence genes